MALYVFMVGIYVIDHPGLMVIIPTISILMMLLLRKFVRSTLGAFLLLELALFVLVNMPVSDSMLILVSAIMLFLPVVAVFMGIASLWIDSRAGEAGRAEQTTTDGR